MLPPPFLLAALADPPSLEAVDRSWAVCDDQASTTVEALIDGHDALLIGEMHGTAEMPAMLAKIVDAAARRKERVVLALEYEAEDQAAIDAFVADEDAPFPFDTQDGRSSGAMADMLRRVAKTAQREGTVTVAAVDTWPKRGTTPYDAPWLPGEIDAVWSQRDIGMGQLALAACAARDCDLLIYYAGNMHTRRRPATGGWRNGRTGEVVSYLAAPAGYVIDHDRDAVAINLVHRGGAIKAKAGDEARFGVHRYRPSAPTHAEEDGVPYCAAGSAVYDYVLSVGTLTASARR